MHEVRGTTRNRQLLVKSFVVAKRPHGERDEELMSSGGNVSFVTVAVAEPVVSISAELIAHSRGRPSTEIQAL